MSGLDERERREWVESWRLAWSAIGRGMLALQVMRRPGVWILSPSEKVALWQHTWAIISRAELARRASFDAGFRAGCTTWPSTYADGVQAGVNSASADMLQGMRLLFGERLAAERRHERGDWRPVTERDRPCSLCGAVYQVDGALEDELLRFALDHSHVLSLQQSLDEGLCPTAHPRSFGHPGSRARCL